MNIPSDLHKASPNPTIFREILDSNLSQDEKTFDRLGDEAYMVVGAGADSVKNTISIAVCHLLLNPVLLDTLKGELIQAWHDVYTPPSLQVLEKLPFLTGVIQEGSSSNSRITRKYFTNFSKLFVYPTVHQCV